MMHDVTIRRVASQDRAEYQRMRLALWPGNDESEIDQWLAREDARTFVAARPDGSLCGFVEVGTRNYAEGCDSSPVAYIEGWWVDADVRRRGVGRALFVAAESWARERGHREIASDALLENTVSHESHRGCGYEEVERLVVFRKSL
jgi:aminoglycoside 6'-N-acetyltransferase I